MNTNTNTLPKAMLAHKFDHDRVEWDKPTYMQPKLDGVRCLLSKKGGFSRNNKQFKNIEHIENSLKEFFNKNPNTILDGELYSHELRDNFEKIISLVRKQKPTDEDREEAKGLTEYHVYDYISQPVENYQDRLDNLTCSDFYNEHIKFVQTRRVPTPAMAKVIHQEFLDMGYEGSILRTDTPYKHGRSFGLLKFKDFHDTEATIVGYEAGKGKFEGLIGKFIMQDDDGIEFGCPIGKGFDFKDRRGMLENIHYYMGKRATFTFFGRTKANSYRHPHFKTLRNYE